MTTPDDFDKARDTAQQAVTALLAGDRHLAGDIIDEYPHHKLLACVLADLCAYVHVQWTVTMSFDGDREGRLKGWQAIMRGIEEERMTR
jgi:hypothetical protein